jgi:hypothetical protein
MAPMNPDQYYHAHCGCMFFPCGGGVTQHSHISLRQHSGTNATSRALPSRPYDPANAPHNPFGRIDEDQEMNDSASSPPADGSYNMNTGEGPSSSNTTRNQAAYELRRRDSVMSMLADDLRRWPTDQETDDYSAEMRVQPLAIRPRQEADPLPDLFDINRTGIQRRQLIEEIDDEPAESTHELGPRSGTPRRRRHAEAFGITEAEPPLHEAQRRRIDTGSRPAQQGYPGNYQPPTVEDAPDSPPMAYRRSIRRQTNQPSNANARNLPQRGEEATLHHGDLRRGGTENQLPPTVRSGNARSRGGGPYSPGPRRRHGRRRYSPYQSSSSDDSRNSTGRPGNPLSRYLEEDDDDDDDDDGHHTY